jgi:GNAT superfamily N-acetyltransferase
VDEFFRPCLLDADKHRRSEFSCGVPAYDEWLRRYAGQNRKGNTAATWVITDRDRQVVAYATLSMSAVDRSACPRDLAAKAPSPTPALLIGRLATDRRVAGRGLATQMVKHILTTAIELNHRAAFRAVIVNALNADAYQWWQRFGFVPLDTEDTMNFDLYLLTKDIEATLSAQLGDEP